MCFFLIRSSKLIYKVLVPNLGNLVRVCNRAVEGENTGGSIEAMSSLGMASSSSQMNKSWLRWRTGSSGVRSSPSTAEASAAIGASNREGEGSIVISLTPELLSSFHIRKRIIVISDSLPRYRHFDYA